MGEDSCSVLSKYGPFSSRGTRAVDAADKDLRGDFTSQADIFVRAVSWGEIEEFTSSAVPSSPLPSLPTAPLLPPYSPFTE